MCVCCVTRVRVSSVMWGGGGVCVMCVGVSVHVSVLGAIAGEAMVCTRKLD